MTISVLAPGPRLLAVLLGLAGASLGCRAQFDHTLYGVADLSYGRFEPSGFESERRFGSNSLSASFVGINAIYGLDGGWKPGVTLETFVRFQPLLRTGRNDDDPRLSRKAFASLGSDYGTLSIGRLQTLLFDTTTRFNALGNSIGFSPAVRQVFLSGNLDGVQGDFYWSRGIGYVSPTWEGVTASAQYARGRFGSTSDLAASNVVVSRGAFAAALTVQRVHRNDGINDATDEVAWQAATTYNFGWARVFGLYTRTNDNGLEVHSDSRSAGAAVPLGLGTVQVQIAYTTAKGVAIDRRHTSVGAAYVYDFDSLTDFYVAALEDRVRAQTNGRSVAVGLRYRF